MHGASSGASLRTGLLSALAIVGFAANSLLTRLALRPDLIDADSFAAVRLSAGAIALFVLAHVRKPPASLRSGSWQSALFLVAYAAPFSYAYVHLGAGTGALILFGTVQLTMIGWGLLHGERPRGGEWFGLTLALSGLVALSLPGATRPDVPSFLLMVVAGGAWAAYSLRGRMTNDALGATAGNFALSVPLVLVWCGSRWVLAATVAHARPTGVILAIASGAVASGLAYTCWYAALPRMTSLAAALVQLIVPVLAAVAAVVLLDEPLTARLVGASVLVLVGVSVAIWSRRSGG